MNNPTPAPTAASVAVPDALHGPKPLKNATWRFPLGACRAMLVIEADAGGEIGVEDMDALIEIATLFRTQMVRRAAAHAADGAAREERR